MLPPCRYCNCTDTPLLHLLIQVFFFSSSSLSSSSSQSTWNNASVLSSILFLFTDRIYTRPIMRACGLFRNSCHYFALCFTGNIEFCCLLARGFHFFRLSSWQQLPEFCLEFPLEYALSFMHFHCCHE